MAIAQDRARLIGGAKLLRSAEFDITEILYFNVFGEGIDFNYLPCFFGVFASDVHLGRQYKAHLNSEKWV
jgi:hypothetical protein